VANGRARFEAAACGQSPQSPQQVPPPLAEKPLRFFSSSRSRGNSPLLPVRTPKVPPVAQQQQPQPTNGKEQTTTTPLVPRRRVYGAAEVTTTAPKVPTGQQPPIATSKLFPKMRR
jgi:hypothetical protein